MPGSGFFTLTRSNALADSSVKHEVSVDQMLADLRTLEAEMESSVKAMNGNALPAFHNTMDQVKAAFGVLAQKYGLSALAQGWASNEAHNADELNLGEFLAVQRGFPTLSQSGIQL